MSTPQTKIYICQSLGLSNDYKHTFWFDNVDEQTEFFKSKVIHTFLDYSYARKNWSLKIGTSINVAQTWGYLFFQNYPTGKYYYYFINNVKYISDETVELELEMDVMQTYLFDYALQPSFVEREHASTDNIGDNTIDEDLELGLMINGNKNTPDIFNGQLALMVMTTCDAMLFTTDSGSVIDGVYSGCPIYRVRLDDDNMANNLMNHLIEKGKTDIIVSMWLMPEGLVNARIEENDFSTVESATFEGVDYYPPVRPSTIDGYTPKNNKLFTYPYCYLYATNNAGNSAVYRYERFENGVAFFNIKGSVFPDGGIKVTPLNYNGTGVNYDESITLTSLPTCPWVGDPYKIWLAQNQSQHMMSNVTSGLSLVGGGALAIAGLAMGNLALAGGGVATAISGATSIGSQLAVKSDMDAQPPQARGSFSSTLNTSLKLFFTFYQKTLTAERAEIIDNYFTMFGYKTLRVKTPNRNVRESFTYTKTQGCLITGSMCQEDVRKIQTIYDNGVTFWQKNVSIGNYSASNAVK